MKKILLLFGTRLEEVEAGTLKMIGTDLVIIVDKLISYLKISLYIWRWKSIHKIVNLIKESYAK